MIHVYFATRYTKIRREASEISYVFLIHANQNSHTLDTYNLNLFGVIHMYWGYQIHKRVTSGICYLLHIQANLHEYCVSRINYT